MADWIMFGVNREVRRVPLDFKWPLHERWHGYVPPKWRDCPDPGCSNGYNPDGAWLLAVSSLLAVAGQDGFAGSRRPHPRLSRLPAYTSKRAAGRGMVDLYERLTGREVRSGLDFHAHRLADALLEKAGLDRDWSCCQVCKGSAIHPDDREASEAWEATEPPTGPGWQLWETVSEGSPISPVFATADALVDWATEHATIFGDDKAPRDTWERIVAGSAELWPLNGRENSANG